MLTTRPLTLILLLCVCLVSLGAIGILVCKDDESKCGMGVNAGMSVISLLICLVCCFAVFFVESMGHRTGMTGMAGGGYAN